MRQALKVLIFALAFVYFINGQGKTSMNEVLLPSPSDIAEAKNQGLEVFKLAPRGMFDYEQNELSLRGGGAYYSFVKKSHSYNEIPQIELQDGKLSVGFYGANYGFIGDLGEIPLAEVQKEMAGVQYLAIYKPAAIEPTARQEYRLLQTNYKTEKITYKKSLPAVVGKTYVLRAVSYDEADTLVAFKIYRKDADGSLVIFWKLLENFEKPVLVKSKRTTSTDNIITENYSGGRAAKIQEALRKKGFTQVKVSEENNIIVLRGKYPKGRLSEAIQTAQEANEGKPLRNEMTEF